MPDGELGGLTVEKKTQQDAAGEALKLNEGVARDAKIGSPRSSQKIEPYICNEYNRHTESIKRLSAEIFDGTWNEQIKLFLDRDAP